MGEYRKIPGYSRYEVDCRGNARCVIDDSVVLWHKSNGYIFTVLVDDLGNRRSVGQHRVVALAYIPRPNTTKRLTVNHLDGDKTNNFHKNLEWATYGANTLHAYQTGLRSDRIPVICTHIPTGEVKKFFSKGDCCRHFGWGRKVLSNPKFIRSEVAIVKQYKLQFLTEESTWTNVCEYPYGVVARNIVNGNLITASTPSELGAAIELCPKVIRRIISGKRFQYPTGGYDIRVVSKDIKWPSYSDDEISAFREEKFIHQPILVEISPNKTVLCGSIKKAAELTRTYERAIRWCLKKNAPTPTGYVVKKYSREVIINS